MSVNRVSIGSANGLSSIGLSKPTLGHCQTSEKFHSNCEQNTKIFIHENAFQNVICEMVTSFSRGRWVVHWYAIFIKCWHMWYIAGLCSRTGVTWSVFKEYYDINLFYCCHIFPCLCAWCGCTIIHCRFQMYPEEAVMCSFYYCTVLWCVQMIE